MIDLNLTEICIAKKSRAGLIELVQTVDLNPVAKSLLTLNISRLDDGAVMNICAKAEQAISLYKAGDNEGLRLFAIENKIPVDVVSKMFGGHG